MPEIRPSSRFWNAGVKSLFRYLFFQTQPHNWREADNRQNDGDILETPERLQAWADRLATRLRKTGYSRTGSHRSAISVYQAIFYVFWPYLFAVFLAHIAATALRLWGTRYIYRVLLWVERNPESTDAVRGLTMIFGVLGIELTAAVYHFHVVFWSQRVSLWIQSALSLTLYRILLRPPPVHAGQSRSHKDGENADYAQETVRFSALRRIGGTRTTTYRKGTEAHSLLVVDVPQIATTASRFLDLLVYPINIVVAYLFVLKKSGAAGRIVIAVVVTCMVLIAILEIVAGVLREKYLHYRDIRFRYIYEILSQFKTLHLLGWGRTVQEEINTKRKPEMRMIRIRTWIRYTASAITQALVPITHVAFFSSCILIYGSASIQPSFVFSVKQAMDYFTRPLTSLGRTVEELILGATSAARFQEHFQSERVVTNTEDRLTTSAESAQDPSETIPCLCSEQDSALYPAFATPLDITTLFVPGKLIIIVGEFCAGCLALPARMLSAHFGEDAATTGTVGRDSSGRPPASPVGYAPYPPWVPEGGLERAILLYRPYRWKRLYAVLEACELLPDCESWGLTLEDLETRDGLKGDVGIASTLSGGQRTRIGVARAIYGYDGIKAPKFCLLERPFDAVDQTVGTKICRNLFEPGRGLLSQSTTIVTMDAESFRFYQLIFQTITASQKATTEAAVFFSEDFGRQPEIHEYQCHQHAITTTLDRNLCSEATARHARSRQSRDNARVSSQAVSESATVSEESSRNFFNRFQEESRGIKDSRVWSWWLKTIGFRTSSCIVFFTILERVALTAAGFWMMYWTVSRSFKTLHGDGEQTDPDGPLHTMFMLLVYVGLCAATMVCTSIRFYLRGVSALYASKRVHDGLVERLLNCPEWFFNRLPLSLLTNRVGLDIYRLDTVVHSRQWRSFTMMCVASMLVISVCLLSPILTVGAAASLYAVLTLWIKRYSPANSEVQRLRLASRTPLCQLYTESEAGAPVITTLGQQKRYEDANTACVQRLCQMELASLTLQCWFRMRAALLVFPYIIIVTGLPLVASMAGVAALRYGHLVWFTVLRGNSGIRTAAFLGFCINKAFSIPYTLDMTLSRWHLFQGALGSVKRVYEVFELCDAALRHERSPLLLDEAKKHPKTRTPCAVQSFKALVMRNLRTFFRTEKAAKDQPLLDSILSSPQTRAPESCWTVDFSKEKAQVVLRLTGMTIGYSQYKFDRTDKTEFFTLRKEEFLPILQSVTCQARIAEHIGIVGRTGSGKSTLLLALTGRLPLHEGTLLYCGTALQRKILPELSKSIAIIPQFPVLLSGWTYRQLLDPTMVYTDAELLSALTKVGLNSAVSATSKGLDAEINQRHVQRRHAQAHPEDIEHFLRDEQPIWLLFVARLALTASSYRLLLIDEPPFADGFIPVSNAGDCFKRPTHRGFGQPIGSFLKNLFPQATILIVAHHAPVLRHCDALWILANRRITVVDNQEIVLSHQRLAHLIQ